MDCHQGLLEVGGVGKTDPENWSGTEQHKLPKGQVWQRAAIGYPNKVFPQAIIQDEKG